VLLMAASVTDDETKAALLELAENYDGWPEKQPRTGQRSNEPIAANCNANRPSLLAGSTASYIPAAMIRGRIAIPDVDPKTWRSRGRKKKRTQPALASAIVAPAPMKKRRQMTDDQEQPQRSAIAEPEKSRNTMLLT
jgi:hypothetical protein